MSSLGRPLRPSDVFLKFRQHLKISHLFGHCFGMCLLNIALIKCEIFSLHFSMYINQRSLLAYLISIIFCLQIWIQATLLLNIRIQISTQSTAFYSFEQTGLGINIHF